MELNRLLPQYLKVNDVWVNLMDSIDTVITPLAFDPIDTLKMLNYNYLYDSTTLSQQVPGGQLLDSVDLNHFERALLLKMADDVGFQWKSSSYLSNDIYERIIRTLPQYWFSNGTQNFMQYFSFVLGGVYYINQLWSQDYVNFYPLGDPHIGLPVYTQQTKSLLLDGLTGDYVSAPSVSSLNIGGNLDIQVETSLVNWIPSNTQCLVSKANTTGNQYSYSFNVLSNGRLQLLTSTNGLTYLASTSTVNPGFAANSTNWVRATLRLNNGTSGNTTTFYTSVDGVNWTQLGFPIINPGITSIYASTAELEIGSTQLGTINLLTGSLNRVKIYSGIAGIDPIVSLACDFNINDWFFGSSFISSTTNNVFTFHGTVSTTLTPSTALCSWYPTSLVNMYYDLLNNPNIDVPTVSDLFDYIAPVNLVLHQIIGVIQMKIQPLQVMVAGGMIVVDGTDEPAGVINVMATGEMIVSDSMYPPVLTSHSAIAGVMIAGIAIAGTT